MTETSNTTSTTLLDGMRVAIDLIAAHPELPTPSVFAYSTGSVDVTWQLMHNDDTKDDQRGTAQRIIRAIGGHWSKNPWGDRFDFERQYDGVKLEIYAHRDQVCERRVVGTETVTIPAVEAQAERTETREVIEWDCNPVLTEAVSA